MGKQKEKAREVNFPPENSLPGQGFHSSIANAGTFFQTPKMEVVCTGFAVCADVREHSPV